MSADAGDPSDKLQEYLEAKGLRRSAPKFIERTPRDGFFPLSFAQQRIWFVEQAIPDTSMYNMPECARIRGDLDVDLVGRAADWVVARHEAWRTTFHLHHGRPAQIVHPDATIEITRDDCADETAARARLADFCARPFNLAERPLVRIHLVALAPFDHMLLLNVHHIVSDGWSTGIFVREFLHAYTEMSAGQIPRLDPPPLQHGDFVMWQRRTFSGQAFDALVQRWSKMVGPENGYAELPSDRPRPAGADDSGEFLMLALSRERSQALRTTARRLGVTLFVLLATAFKLALARLTGVWNLSLGVPIASRNRVQFERVIGLFANTVVLHSDLSGDPTLAEAVRREQHAWIAAQAYQHVPFERLVELAKPTRTAGRHPFFQIMFILQNTPMPSVALPGMEIEFIATGTQSVKFDLVFELYEAEEGLRGWLGYLQSLFDRRTITRLVDLFQEVLEAIPGSDERQLSSLGARPPSARDMEDFLEPL